MTTRHANTVSQLERDTLADAAEALLEHDRLRAALRASDDRLRALCRQYDVAARVWATRPEHLRHACETRGLLDPR
jgi:hypothetical protein